MKRGSLKRRSLVAACLLTLFGCSADHTIADDAERDAAELRERTPEFCMTACERFASCAAAADDCSCSGDICECTTPDDAAECAADCQQTFDEVYLSGESGCAELGFQLMDCVNTATCLDIETNTNLCRDISERGERCGRDGAVVPDDAPDPVPGPPPSGGTVSCSWGTGTGQAGSTGMPAPTPMPLATCDNAWNDCSDGHDYRLICLAAMGSPASCACYVDAMAERTFAPSTMGCPTTQEVNAQCGWRLSAF